MPMRLRRLLHSGGVIWINRFARDLPAPAHIPQRPSPTR
jgi:hypothetical protein